MNRQGVDSGEPCTEANSMWEILVSSAQFCCKPKNALKNKAY